MNVVGPVKQSSLVVAAAEEDSTKTFKASENIFLYDEAPTVELSLDQFEIYALKRLKVMINRMLDKRCRESLPFCSNVYDLLIDCSCPVGPSQIGTHLELSLSPS